jgi:hypothetical protein
MAVNDLSFVMTVTSSLDAALELIVTAPTR